MSLRTTTLSAALALATTAGLANAQTFSITPGGANSGNGVFAYTQPSGILAATTAGLTAGSGTNYTLSSTTNGTLDHAWRFGWFFRLQSANREYAFPNAASGVADGITANRTAIVGSNLGTESSGGYDYNITTGTVAVTSEVRSQQRWSISNTGGVVTVDIVNSLVNLGTTPVTISLFWIGDLDIQAGFGDDTATVSPTAIAFANANASGQTVTATRGNSNAYIVRGAVTGIGATTAFDEMTNNSIINFDNTNLSSPTGGDVTYGLQWTVTIEPGSDFTAFTSLVVPTPGAMALLGMGGLLAARRRR
ncbi:MAG: PEP-CTERM sorting domain-containing protein [Phycisphaerales bacterium]|nr:PEP-CTERM sorting domain-containing protein [Phycisphaerales bacterium]